MTLIPTSWMMPAFLAAVLLGDAALSIKPVRFIRDCLHSVRFPENWWWSLLVIKLLAAGVSSREYGCPDWLQRPMPVSSHTFSVRLWGTFEQKRRARPFGSTAWGCWCCHVPPWC